MERHPTGPNTAAQPGKGRRARCVSWTFPLALEDNYPGPKTHNRPPVHGSVYGDCDVGVAPWRVGHRTGWSQRCCPAERAPRSVCCLRIPPHRLVKNKLPAHLSTSHSPKIHDSCSSERLILDFRSFSTASAALDPRDQKDPPPGDSGATQRRSAEDRAPCSATFPKLPAKEGG